MENVIQKVDRQGTTLGRPAKGGGCTCEGKKASKEVASYCEIWNFVKRDHAEGYGSCGWGLNTREWVEIRIKDGEIPTPLPILHQ